MCATVSWSMPGAAGSAPASSSADSESGCWFQIAHSSRVTWSSPRADRSVAGARAAMRAVSPRATASASGTTAGSWKGRAESLFAADMLACSLAPAGSAAHETIRMDVARAARAGTCLRLAGSFPTDVAFASRMGPWRDRSILAPARRPWRRDFVIAFGNLAVGRSAREHAPDLGDELRVDLAADLLGAGDDASFAVEQHQCAGVVELAVGQLPVAHAEHAAIGAHVVGRGAGDRSRGPVELQLACHRHQRRGVRQDSGRVGTECVKK